MQLLDAGAGQLRVVVTTRHELPTTVTGAGSAQTTHVHAVGPVGMGPMSEMVSKMVGGAGSGVLGEGEAAEVAAACCGVPLLTRLAADALAHGRMDLTVSGGIVLGRSVACCTALLRYALSRSVACCSSVGGEVADADGHASAGPLTLTDRKPLNSAPRLLAGRPGSIGRAARFHY